MPSKMLVTMISAANVGRMTWPVLCSLLDLAIPEELLEFYRYVYRKANNKEVEVSYCRGWYMITSSYEDPEEPGAITTIINTRKRREPFTRMALTLWDRSRGGKE